MIDLSDNPVLSQLVSIGWKKWAGIAAIIIFILIILDGLVSVPAGHVSVIFDRGRGVLEKELPEGLHLKIPFWQSSTLFDTRLQTYTMSIAPEEGYLSGDDSIESLTSDGQKVLIDATVQYRISADDASWILQNTGGNDDNIDKVIRPVIRNVTRDVITGYDSTKLFQQASRIEAQEKMLAGLAEVYKKNKVQAEAVLLRNIKFSDTYLQAIENKQVAQQKIQEADFQRQEAEKRKEKTIIEAQAEAESIRLKGEMLRKNPEVIQFEFVQKMAGDINWGVLPDNIIPMLNLGSR